MSWLLAAISATPSAPASPPSLTGTPVAIDWTQAASPSAQNITIPADCTAVYLFAAAYGGNNTDINPTATLDGSAPDESINDGNDGSGTRTTGAGFVWLNPPTGVQPLAITWPGALSAGPVSIVAFTKDGGASRDSGAISTSPDDFDLTTETDDLVLKFNAQVGSAPALEGGWTDQQSQALYGDGARLSSISASGTTTTINESTGSFPATVAFAIPPV